MNLAVVAGNPSIKPFPMKKFLLALLVTIISVNATAQYCTPLYYFSGISSGAMSGFSVSGHLGSSISDLLPGTSLSSGYVNRTSAVTEVNLQQGRTYPGTVTYYSGLAHTGNQVWIDFNNDNVFADSEEVTGVFPSAYSFTTSYSVAGFSLYIPVNAPVGVHRMRVRNVSYYLSYSPGYGSSALSSCNIGDAVNQYYSGVTADYLANVVSLPGCLGFPIAGDVSGPASVCGGIPFDLSLVNDTVAGGLLYQWYSKPLGSGTMSPISGATGRIYHNPGQLAATQYQAVVTCFTSGSHDSSVMTTVMENPYYACYCNAALGGNSTDCTLDSVAIAGTTLNNYVPHNPNLYTAFPDSGSYITGLEQGVTYNLFIGSGGSRKYNAYMWIDFDHSSTFDPGEYTVIGNHINAGGSAHVSFTVPLTADTGITRLRIRTIHDTISIPGAGACNFEGSGETEDYFVHITPLMHCSGIPVAGAVSSSVSGTCPGLAFYLSATGYTLSPDITFQWLSRPAGTLVFAPISGATSSLFAVSSQVSATDYALSVNCSLSGMSDTSIFVTVTENPFYLCYCSPPNGTTLNDIADQSPIDSVYIPGTSVNNPTPFGAGLYSLNYPVTLTTSTNLQQGYYYSVGVNSNGIGNYNAAVWVDFNHDGNFEDSEYVPVASSAVAGTTSFGAFTVPSSSSLGLTGMRVRTSVFAFVMGSSDACTEEFYGSTADYVVNITPGLPCVGAPFAGIAGASVPSVCPGQPFTLSASGTTVGSGISYQWMSKPSGSPSFSVIPGATGLIYIVAGQP